MDITSPGDLAAAIRGRRTNLGLSQADLAVRAGVSRPWLSKVEAGKASVEFGLIIRLLEALGLTMNLKLADARPGSVDLDAILKDYES
jgi:HTH-type transcriptional regulator / antitoxin HipB